LIAVRILAIYVSQKPRAGPKVVVVPGFARNAPKGSRQSKMGDEKALWKVRGLP